MAITTIIGSELAVTVTLGFYGGGILDKRLDTEPWLMVAGVLMGVAVGIWGIVNTMKRFWESNKF